MESKHNSPSHSSSPSVQEPPPSSSFTSTEIELIKEIQESWMAKNTCFDFDFLNARNSQNYSDGQSRTSVASVKVFNTYRDDVERLSFLEQKLLNAVQIMIHDWTENIVQEKSDDNDCSKELVMKWFDKLISLHSKQERAYHTFCHIEEMFGFVDLFFRNNQHAEKQQQQHYGGDNDNVIKQEEEENIHYDNKLYYALISICIFFHDAIYDAKSSTNEEDSLNLYKTFEKELFQHIMQKNFHDEDTWTSKDSHVNMRIEPKTKAIPQLPWKYSTKVSLFILATKSHNLDNVDLCGHEDHKECLKYLKLFLDADMAVLGKDHNAYDHYASLIRKEYIHVPHDVYCEKRAEVLQSFVSVVSNVAKEKTDVSDKNVSINREKAQSNKTRYIFASKIMREALEKRAINNLQREIGGLKQGKIPRFS